MSSRKNRSPEEQARRAKIRELLQESNISSMEDIQNLFKETIAEFMENGLDAELDDELGYSKYDYKNKEEETKLQNDPLAKPPKVVKPKSKTADKPVVSNKPEKKTDSSVKKPAPVKPAPAKPVPIKPQQKTNKK